MVTLVDERSRAGRMTSRLPQWWPLAALVYGYPLWWILGLTAVVPVLMALFMAHQLWRIKPVILPRGLGWWLLFLVWVALGLLTLWVDAPGAVPGGDLGRVVPYAYRAVWYLTCTVVLLWVSNVSRQSAPFKKIVSILAWMFVIAAFGGLLGVLAPQVELRSLLELVLPGGVRSNSFVKSLVHPALADIQNVLGRPEARPKAPFPYANTWGAVLALSLPFFTVAWIKNGSGKRRWMAGLVMVVAAVPTVYSLNRGLWACLAAGLVFLVAVGGWRGRPSHLLAMVAVVAVVLVALVASPLGAIVGERFENQHSNDRRGELLVKSVTSAAEGSPIVGFGSTRDVQGSFASIAGGGTPDCPACEVPPLGTQGHLWLVIFSQGLVGAVLFVVFFAGALWRSIRCRTTAEVIASAVLIFFGIQMFVYDTLGIPLLLVMTAIGLAWRDQSLRTGSDIVRFRVLTVRALLDRIRAYRRWWVLCPLVGAVLGLMAASAQPQRYAASESILLSAPPSYLPTSSQRVKPPEETTVDTEAALAMAERTMARSLGTDDVDATDALRQNVRVTAIPNTRVLVIKVTADSRTAADAAAASVSQSYLETRRDYLGQRRDQFLLKLRERQTELATLGGPQGRFLDDDQRNELADLGNAITDIVLTPTDAGELLRTSEAVEVDLPYALGLASGAALGILLASAVTALGQKRRPETKPGGTTPRGLVSKVAWPPGA